jgi:hypothetical protein
MKHMKKTRWILSGMLTIALFALVMVSCDDDDEPRAFTVDAATAGAIDLNGATSPSNVPVDPTITVTFTSDIDASTATDANIKLIRDYDDAEIPLTISAAGPVLTVTPDDDLASGALYQLNLGSGLMSAQAVPFVAVSRTFTTEGNFAPSGVIAHFTFENNADDVIGSYDPAATDIVAIEYVASRKAGAGQAASFNGTTSIIEIPNGDEFMENKDFTLSFWVKANSTKNGQFVLGLAAFKGFQFEIAGDWAWVKLATQYDLGDGTTDAEDSWFNGSGETKDTTPPGWQGWTFHKNVTASGGVGDTYFKDKWAHVVVTFDAAKKVNTMYINGEKVKEHDFNLWPTDSKKKNVVGVKYAGNAAPGDKLALGFVQGRENRTLTDDWADYDNETLPHFKGLLDDVRIFSVPVTATEVTLMYNSEKP